MSGDLLRKVELHLRRTGESPTTFGRAVAKDPQLVFDMRRGRSPRPRLVAKIECHMRAVP